MEPTKEAGVGPGSGSKPVLGPVVEIDEGSVQAQRDEVVGATVEETLDAEADHLCGAEVRVHGRAQGHAAGSYDRQLTPRRRSDAATSVAS